MSKSKVIVLGAGAVGVATAYYLWRDGHSVTVVDRRSGAGQEASYGNAGGLCPSFAGPWAAPGMIGKVLKMAVQRDSAIRFSFAPNIERMRWALDWASNCNARSFAANKAVMQRSAHYSLACLRQLAIDTGLQDFDFHSDGTLQVFRTQLELDIGRLASQTLDALGIPFRLLDADQARAMEPALAVSKEACTGALHLPADATGDSHKFCVSLSRYLQDRGVEFRFGEEVASLDQVAGSMKSVTLCSGQTLPADAFVMALGSGAPALLKPLGMRLPVYPLKGYSITVPIVDSSKLPQIAIMDEHHKIMVSRLGDRLRVAGMAELVGHDLTLTPGRRELLIRLTRQLFPQGLDFDRVEFWAGLRPMTPDGPPVLGATRIKGLFLNSGHGSNGWTQACGTSRIVVDLISGKKPAIAIDGMTGDRFGLTK